MSRRSAGILILLVVSAWSGAARGQLATDAISREFTVYVDQASYPPQTDAMSRELTVYVGNQPLREQTDAVTREFTVYIDAATASGITDAVTREFSVYVGNQPLRNQTDAVSREFTVDVDVDGDFYKIDAISREFTIYVGNQPLREQTDCWSREFTVTTYPPGRGDLNCDFYADGRDIPFLIFALMDPAGYQAALPFCEIVRGDMNFDGNVDQADIEPFAEYLTGSE